MKRTGRNWYREAYCKLHFDMHTPEAVREIAAAFDPEEFVRRLKIASPDAICFFAKSAFGWAHYPTTIGARHPHLQKDLLGEALRVCRREGIRLIGYYCIEVLPPVIAERHPEYLMRDKGGKPVQQEGRFISCMNSAVRKEVFLPQLKEILENYEVDGLFFDGFPAMHQTCYCEHCRRLFGEEIPGGAVHPGWRRFLAWQQEWLDAWCAETGNFIHAVRPEVLVGVNYLAANRYAVRPPAGVDYLTADFPVSDNCAIWTSYQLSGWGWRELPCDVMNARMLHWWSDYTCRPAAALKTEYAAAIARGGSLFLGDLFPPDTSMPDVHVMELAREGFEFARARRSVMEGARPAADIALVNGTADHLEYSAGPNRDEAALRGAFLTAVESGHTAHVLLDSDLAEHLAEYKAVCLCDTRLLVAGACDLLRKFVLNGGAVVVCGSVPRGVDGDSLEDVLGVSAQGESDGDRAYLRVPDEHAAEFWPEWEPVRPWVLVHGRYPLVMGAGAEIVAPVVLPGAKFQIGAQAPAQPSRFAGITKHSAGKGRAAFCPLSLAADYFKRANSGAKHVLSGMLNYAVPDRSVVFASDTTVEIALARKPGALIVHLLAYHAERRAGNPPVVERIPRLRDIRVRALTSREPVRVVQQPEGRPLEWVFAGGAVETTVPEMNIHTAIVIERQDKG